MIALLYYQLYAALVAFCTVGGRGRGRPVVMSTCMSAVCHSCEDDTSQLDSPHAKPYPPFCGNLSPRIAQVVPVGVRPYQDLTYVYASKFKLNDILNTVSHEMRCRVWYVLKYPLTGGIRPCNPWLHLGHIVIRVQICPPCVEVSHAGYTLDTCGIQNVSRM